MMPSAIDQDARCPVAPRAGADLRAARERVGWSLPDVAAALHIRLQYLEALEAGRIDDLPGNAYALGFLRTYAQRARSRSRTRWRAASRPRRPQ